MAEKRFKHELNSFPTKSVENFDQNTWNRRFIVLFSLTKVILVNFTKIGDFKYSALKKCSFLVINSFPLTDFVDKPFPNPQPPFASLFRAENSDFLRSLPCRHLPHIYANWPLDLFHSKIAWTGRSKKKNLRAYAPLSCHQKSRNNECQAKITLARRANHKHNNEEYCDHIQGKGSSD